MAMADEPPFRYIDDKTLVLALDEAMTTYLEDGLTDDEERAEAERQIDRIADGLRLLLGPTLH